MRQLMFFGVEWGNIKSRLSGFKSRFLSFGGRLVLLKSVLTSLPVYALSFFKLLLERRSLWYRVLVARYGEEDGRLEVGGRSGSSWWREIAKIRDGLDGVGGGWFQECVSRLVGDGAGSFFWHDPWLDGVSFQVRFRRLFDLAVDKSCTVSHMSSRGWEFNVTDTWRWQLDHSADCYGTGCLQGQTLCIVVFILMSRLVVCQVAVIPRLLSIYSFLVIYGTLWHKVQSWQLLQQGVVVDQDRPI
ncbi:hypothetical protein MTR_6g033030 [Medicago truncatula]|uniref:Uncharacterized protein n=1 Tax=Medicago truncatula TaxID=3880 RepID=A0A072U8A5_MEDTR|nr:hypothetical protein MTR_6g033030 [Medicago truncatula]